MSGKIKRYRVGIVGNSCTHGEFVAAALKAEPGAELAAGWDGDPLRRPGLEAALGMALAASGEAVIEDPSVEIVALACSPHKKADWAEAAAAAGKHIFLNKPFAESLDSARRIVHAVDAAGVQLVHDIPIHRAHPLTAKLLDEVRRGVYGKPIGYFNAWSMTFSEDFALDEYWPERLASPRISGGGELTNMGCYAIDFMLALFGMPDRLQARKSDFWGFYSRAGVENFGQIVADYGTFYALLNSGKQPLTALQKMDVAGALQPRHWHNVMELQFEGHNITAMPYADLLVRDGERIAVADYLAGYEFRSSFRQLSDAIEGGPLPESSARVAAEGVELLMAAYRSALNDGALVNLPLEDGANPLV
ncbi:MAG: Gfo/Idh/MocA family oxidoreductase [Alphaproteobacteria bacterium]